MRDIKFRAYHEINKEMVYFNPKILARDPYQACALIAGLDKSGFAMQFTGLTDKNGVDIYEGDILRVLMTDWPSKLDDDPRSLNEYKKDLSDLYVVGFNGGSFSMSINNDGELDHYIFCGCHGFIEVIGNIHQNPELIKDNNEKSKKVS